MACCAFDDYEGAALTDIARKSPPVWLAAPFVERS
jgi:hypothetical protein